MPTPHLSAPDGAFAPTVLMPGDPKRAQHIAESFLDGAEVVSDVRGMKGFVGTWKGQPLSVMPSGMGIPSAAIYITELARFYGVTRMIRVGTTGAYQPDLALRSIVAGSTATTDSGLPAAFGVSEPIPAHEALLAATREVAAAQGVELHVGPVFSSDIFYDPTPDIRDRNTEAGILCVEMEAAGLYALGLTEGFEALALLTVTDHLQTGEHLSPEERQLGVDEMIALALDVAIT